MNKTRASLLYILIILIPISIILMNSTTGFKTLVDPKDRSCVEEDVCHDISEYKRTTKGDAYPYEHCICHGELTDSSIVVVIEGPRTVEPGASVTYNAKILGGPGVVYGYGINTTDGTLSKNSHFSPLTTNEFDVEFTAPDTPKTVYLTFVGLSGDGDTHSLPKNNLSVGDSWNLNRIPVEIAENEPDPVDDESEIALYVVIALIIAVVVIVLGIVISRSSKKRKKK